jgi:hypothetical protein
MASAMPGGMPGGTAHPETYSIWRTLFWAPTSATNDTVSGPDADPDGDGLNNLLEYLYGLSPAQLNAIPQLTPAMEMINSEPHLAVAIRLSGGASDITVIPQLSNDLATWTSNPSVLQLLSAVGDEDGRITYKYFDASTLSNNSQRFVRFQFNASLP